MMPIVIPIRYWLLIIFFCAVTGTILFWPDTNPKTVVLETEHVAQLAPHEHEDGDSAGDSSHHKYIVSPVFIAPRDMYITQFAFDMVNAPDVVVHHGSLLNFNEPHQTCPATLPFSQLYIMAQDTMHNPVMTFPEGTGMRVKKGDPLQLSVMIHNPLPPVGPGDTYANAFSTLTLTYVEDSPFLNIKEIQPHLLHLDERPCVIKPDHSDAYTFSVPPRTMDFRMKSTEVPGDPSTFTFTAPSTLVYVGAHMHGWQGGKEVIVRKNGEPLLDFKTMTSSTYRYDTPYYPTELNFEAGDTLTLEAVYDNPHDVPTRGAMGALGIYFYER